MAYLDDFKLISVKTCQLLINELFSIIAWYKPENMNMNMNDHIDYFSEFIKGCFTTLLINLCNKEH